MDDITTINTPAMRSFIIIIISINHLVGLCCFISMLCVQSWGADKYRGNSTTQENTIKTLLWVSFKKSWNSSTHDRVRMSSQIFSQLQMIVLYWYSFFMNLFPHSIIYFAILLHNSSLVSDIIVWCFNSDAPFVAFSQMLANQNSIRL